MTYPTSYRRNTLSRLGRVPRLSRRGFPPIPANTNRPPAPVIPFGLSSAPRALRHGYRIGGLLHPAIRIAYEAWQYWRSRPGNKNTLEFLHMGGDWVQTVHCPGQISNFYEHEYQTCNILLHLWKPGVVPEPGPGPKEGPTKWTQHLYWFNGVVVGNMTYYLRQRWELAKPTTNKQVVSPPRRGYIMPTPIPPLILSLDPMQNPVAAPEVSPEPLPYKALPLRRTNPYRVEQSSRGYKAEPTGSEQTSIESPPGTRLREPPRKGEKEAKTAIRDPRLFQAFAHAVTEPLDIIAALWEGLPYSIRRRDKVYQVRNKTTLQVGICRKTEDVWEHFDKIDWQKAGLALIANEIEDRIFGAIGRAGARASARTSDRLGIQRRLGGGGLGITAQIVTQDR